MLNTLFLTAMLSAPTTSFTCQDGIGSQVVVPRSPTSNGLAFTFTGPAERSRFNWQGPSNDNRTEVDGYETEDGGFIIDFRTARSSRFYTGFVTDDQEFVIYQYDTDQEAWRFASCQAA